MCKKAVVSFANKRGNYLKGLARLANSLENNFDGDFIGCIGESSVGAPIHDENPYAFKIYCIERAIKLGYDQILWLDSSCFAIKNIQPIFDEIESNGYIMQEAGHYIGNWTNDKTLDWFGYTRDEAMKMICYGNAGFLGLNFKNDTAKRFFQAWKLAMTVGLFKGSWNNENKTESEDDRCKGHRHDLSCGSIIAHDLMMNLKKGDEWLEYGPPDGTCLNEKIIIKAQGL